VCGLGRGAGEPGDFDSGAGFDAFAARDGEGAGFVGSRNSPCRLGDVEDDALRRVAWRRSSASAICARITARSSSQAFP